ncbi:MAG: glycoside hydrolase [Actinomycetota bacterium]|nr:glycoside hydrolase [Actinomycetota bacterium]
MSRLARLGLFALALGLLALPAQGAEEPRAPFGAGQWAQLSQSVAVRYWLSHPEKAPPELRGRFQAANRAMALARKGGTPATESAPRQGIQGPAVVFNKDHSGMPQNEETVTVCRSDPDVVLMGANDYRGLVDPQGNTTGWYLSTTGGKSVQKEGLLPPISQDGLNVPSGGDPVMVADASCNLFAGGLAFDPVSMFPSGIGIYRTTVSQLNSCPGGTASSCWPNRRLVATAPDPSHFLDKPWFDVGDTGDGQHVWVVYTDFTATGPGPLDFTASIFAVRCTADLATCTAPIQISGSDEDVQFGDVTIGPDNRTYLTWVDVAGELEGTPQQFTIKMRVAEAGSTDFGPTRVVAVESLPIPFGGFLHSEDFRVSTYPKSTVAMVDGHPRVFVVWEGCKFRPLANICEEPRIKLRYSDDDGATWSGVRILSKGGDNYFPTIATDPSGDLAVAWYTSRFDPVFQNRQDVELVAVNPATGTVRSGHRQRVTAVSNEPEADPVLGGAFVGDYIEVFVDQGKAYVGFNANYSHEKLLGKGVPVAQQDDYLAILPL